MAIDRRLDPASSPDLSPSFEGQRRAADPTTHAWVSASAGTGKTKVLTDRVLALLVSGVPPEKILCLTFTKAAAQEMSERVMKALSTWATLPEGGLRQLLETLLPSGGSVSLLRRARKLFSLVLNTPQGLNIQTLHSFCQSFLQRFPLEAGVAPGFVALDDIAQRQLLQQAQHQVLLQNPSQDVTEALSFLSQSFGVTTFEEKLTDLILTSRRPGNNLPDAIELSLEKALGVSPLQQARDLLHASFPREELAVLLGAEWEVLQEGGVEDQKRFKALKAYFALPAEAIEVSDFELLAQTFLKKTGEPRARLMAKKIAEKYPALERTLERAALNIQETQDALQTLHIAQVSRAFLTLAKAVMACYDTSKKRQGFLDYDDLIDHTVRVLKDPELAPWVLYKMDGGLDHILLDEAQDTNDSQWQVLEALTEEFFSGEGIRDVAPTVFVVGDVKQSIYSFQGANPSLFESQRQTFRQRAGAVQASWQDVGLNLSFRSAPAILASVDAVFQGCARQGVGTLEENSLDHKAFRSQAPGRVEVWPLEKEDGEENQSQESAQGKDMRSFPRDASDNDISFSASQKLADKIAKTIRSWIEGKRWLPSHQRAVQPSDILILLQRRGPFLRQLHQALKREGVPVGGEDRLILQDQLCVQDLVALGRFLLLPEDDFSLACVLKSPLINMGEDDLFTLAYQRPSTLWAALIREGHRNSAFKQAHTFLSKLLSLVDRLTPYELYTKVLIQDDKQASFLKRLGNQALDPLQEFLVCVRQYEQQKTPSLQGFLHSFSKEAFGLKRDFSASSHQEVRLMTVHGSKGLQAPIVFLPDTVREPRLREGFLWHEGCPVWNPTKTCEPSSLKRLKLPLSKVLQEEYHRLLYVAMTRAEDELYVAGFENRKGVQDTCWYRLVQTAFSGEFLESKGARPQGENWVLEDALQERAAEAKCSSGFLIKGVPSNAGLPLWATQKAALEKGHQESLAPTHETLEGGEERLSFQRTSSAKVAKNRGILFHKIMEQLAGVAPSERKVFIQKALARPHRGLGDRDLHQLHEMLTRCLKAPHLDFLFSEDGSYEVPISGFLEGQLFTGQIDFILKEKNQIKLIDFKTNQHPPMHTSDIPQVYRRQLEIYKELAAPLYPGTTITTWILWASTTDLMRLER